MSGAYLTIREAVRQGTALLEAEQIAVPRLTAEVLLCHALHKERSYLYAHPEERLTQLAWIHYGRYLHRRLAGVPTQYITGKQEFYTREFRVTPQVLIPRPETEHLVETALTLELPGKRVLDVGTGSGAIAVSVQLESGCATTACDLSWGALEVARGNASRLGAEVGFVQADLLEACGARTFDVILSNPPYIATDEIPGLQREVRDHEPHLALLGGESGNELYARIVARSAVVLRPGGWLVMEMGYRSRDAVAAMMAEHFTEIRTVEDLAGLPRVLLGRLRS